MVARSASLLAAIALLFGLPHCAIDDRDLEETEGDEGGSRPNGGRPSGGTSSGGTSNGGTSSGGTAGRDPLCDPDPDDTECQACARDRCCAQYVGCLTNADCGEYVLCTDACPDSDSNCRPACEDEHPIGSALFFGFAACGVTQCPDLCAS